MHPRWTDRRPQELIVYDTPHPCPYLEGRQARLPMRLPARALNPEELDARLAEGDRRHGAFLYRPACEPCQACEAIRIAIADFSFSRSQRRTLAKGDRVLSLELGEPIVDDARVELYEQHKRGRSLGVGEPIGSEGYRGFLVERCVDAFEMRYRIGDELVALAVVDRSARALSAVYCFWNPAFKHLGVGTYSILKQLELCRTWGLDHLYLGLYIADNAHMKYKARFTPHERLVAGRWQRFD